jgi:ABC-type spermidine/putrescine transport system permease subunit II
MIKFSVTPAINAISTLMLLVSTLLVVLAWWLQGERRNRMLGEV